MLYAIAKKWLVTGVVLSAGCMASAPDRGASEMEPAATRMELTALLDEVSVWEDTLSPLAALYDGEHPAKLDPVALRDGPAAKGYAQRFLARLEVLQAHEGASALVGQQRLSAAVAHYKLTDSIDRYEFGAQLIPMTAEGGFYNTLNFLLPRLPFETVDDFDAFIGWLPSYAAYLDSHLPLLRQGVKQGRVPPQVVIANNLSTLETLVSAKFSIHPNMAPLRRFPEAIATADRQRLTSRARQVFVQQLQPAYQRLAEFLEGEYLAASNPSPGVSGQPGGRAYYANRIRHFTTLPLTADRVFELGESEVARIAAAMNKAIAEAGFSGSRAAFIDKLRREPEFYPESAEALLARAAWLSKTIEGRLPRWFEQLYRLPFTVEPVPATIAATYTSGRYVSGDAEQDRPGIYWVNTTRLKSRALYSLPALTLHEAVPGHHLQHARAAELEGVHPFRKEYYISAFGEGWGLYAEYLGEEMGVYTTPYERFGRLSYEMWRACRLVVDVGLHDRGWTRQRAIEYLARYTALSQLEVTNEIDRYIGWPGQALSYKLGELVIKGLREEAEVQLGEAFDIKAYHEAVLGNGSLPLLVLIDEVRRELQLTGEGIPLP